MQLNFFSLLLFFKSEKHWLFNNIQLFIFAFGVLLFCLFFNHLRISLDYIIFIIRDQDFRFVFRSWTIVVLESVQIAISIKMNERVTYNMREHIFFSGGKILVFRSISIEVSFLYFGTEILLHELFTWDLRFNQIVFYWVLASVRNFISDLALPIRDVIPFCSSHAFKRCSCAFSI